MKKCDIIIPVYNAYDFVDKCIKSILKYTDFRHAHIILVNDQSPDQRITPLLEKYQKANPQKITIIQNQENSGFVKTVNIGMKHSKNDVLLLNSDTEVTPGWLEKIRKCANSDHAIATVTPLSNNATLASVPKFNQKNELPNGYSLERMSKLVEKCSMHLYPEIPSGHGFCMFIKREVIDKVGYFDEETFGRGYGEENDFCFRCFEHGYWHALCDDAYVLHKGTQSFLDTKKTHNDELRSKHPEIMAKTNLWYRRQEIRKVADNVALAMGAEENRPNILVVGSVNPKLLEGLRPQANFHILTTVEGNYILKSFFKDVELVTAIYEKPIRAQGAELQSNQCQAMLREIITDYGISVVCANKRSGLAELCRLAKAKFVGASSNQVAKETLRSCIKLAVKRPMNYLSIRQKMLEYDLIESLSTIRELEKEVKAEQARQKALQAEQQWRDNLTIPQRVYLKIRYILIGR